MLKYIMREVADAHRRASARRAFVVKKYIYIFCFFFRKWPIVSLNKPLIPRAGIIEPFEAALKLQFGP